MPKGISLYGKSLTKNRMQLQLFEFKPTGPKVQELRNSEAHRWYRFVLAFPDHFVESMLDRFRVSKENLVLDPFCGTGTTLVECSKRGVSSVGIDSSPLCTFVSRVKTNWLVKPAKFRVLSEKILSAAEKLDQRVHRAKLDLETEIRRFEVGRHFYDSGMVARGWISPIPLLKALHTKQIIEDQVREPDYRDLFLLALTSVLVSDFANVRFGPEIYCVKPKQDISAARILGVKLQQIYEDLRALGGWDRGPLPLVLEGDARDCGGLLGDLTSKPVDFIITSPPYPTEHDYTRNTRLELVFLGFVRDKKSLRDIKQKMLRSHSKGIYAADREGEHVAEMPEVKKISEELRGKAKAKSYGFAKLYPRIIEEYFGGMYRHFVSLSPILPSGGKCAYVVGDQKTYLQTYTPTAEILAKIAERPECGFRILGIETWRARRGTTGSQTPIEEKVLLLQKR